jgi:hypothetical protein
VVPTRAGTYLIPEIRIPWWDTQTGQVQYAVLPARNITAAAAEPTSNPAAIPVPAPAIDIQTNASDAVAPQPQEDAPLWKTLGMISTLGWILTLIYLWRRRGSDTTARATVPENSSEKEAFKRLLAACADGDAANARGAIIAWAAALTPETAAVSLDQVAAQFKDEEFKRELNRLNACLYSPEQSNWTGASLADSTRRLRREYRKGIDQNEGQIQLYPHS